MTETVQRKEIGLKDYKSIKEDYKKIYDDTFGEKCHWLPHPNQHPGTHDKLHEVLLANLDGSNTDRVHPNISIFQGNLITHLNSDEIHGFPVTHFGGDNVEEAQYRSDREQTVENKQIPVIQSENWVTGS